MVIVIAFAAVVLGAAATWGIRHLVRAAKSRRVVRDIEDERLVGECLENAMHLVDLALGPPVPDVPAHKELPGTTAAA